MITGTHRKEISNYHESLNLNGLKISANANENADVPGKSTSRPPKPPQWSSAFNKRQQIQSLPNSTLFEQCATTVMPRCDVKGIHQIDKRRSLKIQSSAWGLHVCNEWNLIIL